MTREIFWFDIEKEEYLSEIEKMEQARILPVFLIGFSNQWLQGLNQMGIPSYSGDMEMDWLVRRLEEFSPLIFISTHSIKKQIKEKILGLIWHENQCFDQKVEKIESSFLEQLQPLQDVIIRLLGPGGCIYDRAQTHLSLRRNLIEEVYEVIEAIEKNDPELLREELGDLLMQIVFHAQLAEEEGTFILSDVVEEISQKLIRRHPHVFSDAKSVEYGSILANWENIKLQEKGKIGRGILDGIPKGLPALLETLKIQEKAKKVGFDWKNLSEVVEKLKEEEKEFWSAENDAEKRAEIGDIFFTLVSLGRFFSIDPEIALREANERFIQRFKFIESQINQGPGDWSKYSREDLMAFWLEAKETEKK